MKVFRELNEWRQHRQNSIRGEVGFVPTMGALHAGHLSLVRRAQQENPVTAVSIFVNPTQFDNPDDLNSYPQNLDQDLEMLEGVDYVLAPSPAQMYPGGYRYRVSESAVSQILCGAHRPGHFDGMLTVVLKLLQLVAPTRAYFGEKDFQQLQLIQGMVDDFFLPVQIVACPTLREQDDLAMSSRNTRLGPEARLQAREFPRQLRAGGDSAQVRQRLEQAGFQVDYVQDWRGRRLAAVHLGDVRLIDNIPWEVS